MNEKRLLDMTFDWQQLEIRGSSLKWCARRDAILINRGRYRNVTRGCNNLRTRRKAQKMFPHHKKCLKTKEKFRFSVLWYKLLWSNQNRLPFYAWSFMSCLRSRNHWKITANVCIGISSESDKSDHKFTMQLQLVFSVKPRWDDRNCWRIEKKTKNLDRLGVLRLHQHSICNISQLAARRRRSKIRKMINVNIFRKLFNPRHIKKLNNVLCHWDVSLHTAINYIARDGLTALK